MSATESPPLMDTPVLISGAGPAGLYAAILLTKLNIPCRLIERHLEISPLSKALVIHSRTMEIFAMSGIIDKFLERGTPLTTVRAYSGSKLVSVLPVLANKESHFDFGLFLEQQYTSAALAEELEFLGVKVDRGWELMDTKVVEQGDKSWVETIIRRAIGGNNTRTTESQVLGVVELDPDQAEKQYEYQTVKSEYLIGADGGKSVVRHKLNIGFPGRTVDNNIIIFDGHIETDIPVQGPTAIGGVNGRIMALLPLQDGQVRIILDNGILTPEEHGALKPEDLTIEKFEKLVAACIAPSKFKCLDTSWLTYYRVNERQAEHFAYKNRVFLAGDAAHVHSPAGGQGMNLGLQDSHNLTWKLALVMHGIAPASILDIYEAERKPVADAIIKMTARILEVGLAQNFFRRLIRSAVFTIAPYIIPYFKASNNPVAMLTIRYHENAINQHSKSQASIAQDFQVGQRARDGHLHVIRERGMDLAEGEGQVVRLHELTVGPGIFHIAVFTSDMFAASKKSLPVAIKGTETTTAATLAKDIEEHLAAWRSKWTYKSSNEIARSSGNGQDIPPPPSPDFKSPLASSEAIPCPLRANKLIMVHVIASDKISAKPNNANGTHPEVVSDTDPLITKQPGDGKIYLDQQGVLHKKYGVQADKGPGAIVVIRPDSHIGYRVLGASKSAWDDVSRYLDSILIK